MSVEPKTTADQEKMALALQRLGEEDPTFVVKSDEETGQTIISGMGELHLEVIQDRMKREFGVVTAAGNHKLPIERPLLLTQMEKGFSRSKLVERVNMGM